MDYCLLDTVGERFTNAGYDGTCKVALSRGVREINIHNHISHL